MRFVLIVLLAGVALLLGAMLWMPVWRNWLGALMLVALLLTPAVWVMQGLVRAQWRAAKSQTQAAAWVRFMELHCPQCGQQTMPLLRKWGLGWSRQGSCRHCGQRVQNDGLPPALLAGPPLLGVLVAALIVGVVRQLNALAWIFGLGLLGILCSLVLALWRPFLRLDKPTVASWPGVDSTPSGGTAP